MEARKERLRGREGEETAGADRYSVQSGTRDTGGTDGADSLLLLTLIAVSQVLTDRQECSVCGVRSKTILLL